MSQNHNYHHIFRTGIQGKLFQVTHNKQMKWWICRSSSWSSPHISAYCHGQWQRILRLWCASWRTFCSEASWLNFCHCNKANFSSRTEAVNGLSKHKECLGDIWVLPTAVAQGRGFLIRVDESDMACHNKVVLQEAFNDVLARGLH